MSPENIPYIILHDAASATWLHFENPLKIISASNITEVIPALREIETCVERMGYYAAGWISYEAAPAFDEAFTTHPDGFPLLWFGLYSKPRHSRALPPPDASYTLGAWTPSVTRAAYDAAITEIKAQIGQGETYQVNYTFRLRSKFKGSPWSLFIQMLKAQPVAYPAFLDTGRYAICCASPELFFRLDGDQITCRPMKGTARRGRTLTEDESHADALKTSPKERAENVMIVDMLRNDLGRIARTGSVQVPALFNAERYRTLWQMTSTVTAQVTVPFTDLMAALFPCASITGAPKVNTMRLIAMLEDTPRKAYTGTIGFLAPGRQAQFNVAIRSVLIDRKSSEAEYGVGSGVVWDSSAADEYTESLLKTRALTQPQPEFALLETFRWTSDEGWFLQKEHLKRLHDSAIYFDFPFDSPAIEARLIAIAKILDGPARVRLLLHPNGSLAHEAFPLPPTANDKPMQIKLALVPINSQDSFFFHKTTHRDAHEKARAAQPDCDDVLLYNERGELTESTIANLVVEIENNLVTPPISCGLLAGTFRAMLLEQGLVTERIIKREDLAHCTKIFLVNSVRGWMKAEFC